MPRLGAAVWAVNMVNGCFGFWQEFKAEKATEVLAVVHATQAGKLAALLGPRKG
jgi:hypothetical protein